MSTEIIVVTGAAGRIGRSVVPLLRRDGRALRLVDRAEPAGAGEGEWIDASIEDAGAMTDAMRGADAVIHLAGIATEAPWADLLRVNIDGTRIVLESAHEAGVRSVMLASSIHAAGFRLPAEVSDPAARVPRPDSYYGVTKAAMEALGSLYADRFGLTVVSARICTFEESPGDGRTIATWLSAGDAARLCEASIALADGRHHVVWGVSRNAPDWFPLAAGEAIGYVPQDDAGAERRRRGEVVSGEPDRSEPIGGVFTRADHPIGERWDVPRRPGEIWCHFQSYSGCCWMCSPWLRSRHRALWR
ncbi:NAD-dependent epimerase/dehydratase family protein [Microbacterium sp. NPDC055683]